MSEVISRREAGDRKIGILDTGYLINKRLPAIGWNSFELDHHSLHLITASLEAE
jgi:hypothetical protein